MTTRVTGSLRDRGGAPRPLAELVEKAGAGSFRRFGFAQGAVVARWAEIAGPVFAPHSTPEALRFPAGKRAGGTLELRVTGAYAAALSAIEPELIERVNRFFGYAAVSRIRLRHGAPLPAPSPAPSAPAPEPPVALTENLKAIADPALRGSLEKLARALSTTSGAPVFDER